MSNTKAASLATEVARELGPDWTTGEGHWSMSDASDAYLKGPHGEEIHLSLNGYQARGRIELRGSLSHELLRQRRDEKIPSITVAETKTATQIAHDLERRLLPAYRELLAVVQQRKTKDDTAEAERSELMSELLSLVGPGSEHLQRNGLNELRIGQWGDVVHGAVKVHYGGDSVEFEIRTNSRDAALSLARAIREVRRG